MPDVVVKRHPRKRWRYYAQFGYRESQVLPTRISPPSRVDEIGGSHARSRGRRPEAEYLTEAAGVEHVGEPEGRSHLPDRGAETNLSEAKVSGGGGSRTRVREYAVAGVYMRSRS